MPIYQTVVRPLKDIVDNACQGTLMVPDIQRSYVWTPDKIIRLIDTFLKGWPFSSLLLWDTGLTNNANNLIPHRSFKAKISRIEDGIDARIVERSLPAANIPGNITMILDGQQRVQSILIAFSSHDSGLYLLDKEWYSSFSDDGDHPYRGSAVNNRWCFGQLYLNLGELINHVNPIHGGAIFALKNGIDWTRVFRWAIPNNEGFGGTERSDSYVWPIDKLWDINTGNGKNRYIHASHLWEISRGFLHLGEDVKWNKVESLLQNQSANDWDDEIELRKVKGALLGLIGFLAVVRDQTISCLQLHTQVEAGYANDFNGYSEAIVNIFNRLNAAGVALEKDEITSAWIRNRWQFLRTEFPGPKVTGSHIFKEAKSYFNYHEKSFADQHIVKIFNILWVVFDVNRNGDSRLFSEGDLLAGGPVQEMTGWIYKEWDSIKSTLEKAALFLKDSKLEFNYHFKSLNLIYSIIINRFYVNKILSETQPTPDERKKIEDDFFNDSRKWVLITLFSGKWGRNSDSDLISLIRHCRDWIVKNPDCQLTSGWQDNFNLYINSDVRSKAKKHIENFESGDQYNSARAILYAWNCDPARFPDYARMIEPSTDHIIPQALWRNALTANNILDTDDYQQVIHQIGNLNELGRVDNSRKNDSTLSSWLSHTDINRNSIRNAELIKSFDTFKIPKGIADPKISDKNGIDHVKKLISIRSSEIKKDVVEFLGLNLNY